MGHLQHKLVSLKILLDQHKILRAEVRYFPYDIKTYGVPVIENPDDTDIGLEGSRCYQLFLPLGSQKLTALTMGLSQVQLGPLTERSMDCRWGVILRIYGGSDLAIFIDRSGERAIINRQAVNINPRLLKQLEATFMDCF